MIYGKIIQRCGANPFQYVLLSHQNGWLKSKICKCLVIYLKLWVAEAKRNFKWVKITIILFSALQVDGIFVAILHSSE